MKNRRAGKAVTVARPKESGQRTSGFDADLVTARDKEPKNTVPLKAVRNRTSSSDFSGGAEVKHMAVP